MTAGDVQALIAAIRDDRAHGASELARRALQAIVAAARGAPAADGADLQRALGDVAGRLEQARPTMAAVANVVAQWRRDCGDLTGLPTDDARRRAAARAGDLIEASCRAVSRAAAAAAALLGPDRTVITHSMSSTVVAALRHLAPRVTVIVSESRPPGEGRRLAEVLADAGATVDFISDAQLGLFAGRADAALVGADTLAADGAVINKAGTYLLALAAHDSGVPVYVCCESFKRSSLGAGAVALEQHDPQELDPPPGRAVRTHNIYFDVTPARLIDAWITEHGVQHREQRIV